MSVRIQSSNVSLVRSASVAECSSPNLVRGSLQIIAAAMLWGTTGTVATFAPSSASGVSIGAATMGLGGLILVALAGRSTYPLLRAGRKAWTVLLPGAGAIAVYPLAFYSSMKMAGVAICTIVSIGSSPVFAGLFERTLENMRLDRRWTLATSVSAIGIVLLILGGHGDSVHTSTAATVSGVALGLIAGATYAGYSFAARRLIQAGHPSRSVVGVLFGTGSALLLPVLAVTGGALLHSMSGLVVAGYLALVPMALAYVLFGSGLRHVAASTATTLSLIEAVVAAVLSVCVVGERLGGLSWAGAALTGAGLLILISGMSGIRRERR